MPSSSLLYLLIPPPSQETAVLTRRQGVDDADHPTHRLFGSKRRVGAVHVSADPAGIEQDRRDAPSFEPPTGEAPQRVYSLREVSNGRRWFVRAAALWRMMPTDLPSWEAV
jgi:hypothetical protein